jgi:hypothetical protein
MYIVYWRRRHRNGTEEVPLPAPVGSIGSIGSTTEETDFRKEYQLGILFMLILLISFHCKHILMCTLCMVLVAAAVNDSMALEGGGGGGGGAGEAKDQPLRSKAPKGSSTQQDPHQQHSPRTNAAKATPARFK